MPSESSSDSTQPTIADTARELHSAAIHLLRALRRTDAELGIGPARLSALSVLVFGGPRSLGQLAEAEQVKAPTMSRIVAGLEGAGMVAKTVQRSDRRATRIRATSRGRRALQRGRRRRLETLERGMRALSPADVQVLARSARLTERLASG